MCAIKLEIKDYLDTLGYMTPEEVWLNSQKPNTAEEYALYAAAHCMVSERHDKGDLVRMVYAILKREHFTSRK